MLRGDGSHQDHDLEHLLCGFDISVHVLVIREIAERLREGEVGDDVDGKE